VTFLHLQYCCQQHPACQRHEPGRLPKRVIDVGTQNQDPFLYVTNSDHVPYFSLSHCWGGHVSLQLRSDNQRSLQTGIPLGTFPKSFRDAIIITRRLGVRCLWIDALCIIQDDEADWGIEAAAMADVYEGALLNICALAAPNSETGFLYPRADGIVHFSAEDSNGHQQSLFVRMPEDDNQLQKAFDPHLEKEWDADGVLQQRGWTLQVRVLSRANLMFPAPGRGRGMMWECRSFRILETGRAWPSEPRLVRPLSSSSCPETYSERKVSKRRISLFPA
jgi:hypothetical protein